MGDTALGKDSYLLLSKTAPAAGDGLDLVSESLEDIVDVFEDDGIWGGRQQDADFAIPMAERPGGSFVYRPRYGQLDSLFELGLGGGDASTIWKPSDSADLTEFAMELCKAGAAYYAITGCVIGGAVLKSESNGLLTVEPSIVATQCATEDNPTDPDYSNLTGPFIKHSDLVLTGTTGLAGLKVYRYQLTWGNDVDEDGHANSNRRQSKETGLFTAGLELDVSYTPALSANWNTWYRGKTLLNVIATYSNGGNSMVLDFQGIVTSPAPQIGEPGRQRHTITLDGRATKAAGVVTKNMIEAAVTAA